MKKKLFKYLLISMCMASAMSMSACGKKKQTATEYNESVAASRAAAEAEMKALKEQEEERKKQEEKEKFTAKSDAEIKAEQNEKAEEEIKKEEESYTVKISESEVPEEMLPDSLKNNDAVNQQIESDNRQEIAPIDNTTELSSERTGEESSDDVIESNGDDEDIITNAATETGSSYLEPENIDLGISKVDGELSYDIYSLENGEMNVFYSLIFSGAYDATELNGILEDSHNTFVNYPQEVKDRIDQELTNMWNEHLKRKAEWTEEELAADPGKQFYTREQFEALTANDVEAPPENQPRWIE